MRGRAGWLLAPVLVAAAFAACQEEPVHLFSADALEASTGDRYRVAIPGGALATRSVREFSLAQVPPHAPLIERLDDDGRVVGGLGEAETAGNPFLGELVNTGWVAPTRDGGAVFASAVRPLLIRYDAKGVESWRRERSVPMTAEPPRLVRQGPSVRPEFVEMQHGVATGPDDRIYVLTGATADSVRLDVIGAHGDLERSLWIPRGVGVLVDKGGSLTLNHTDPVPPPAMRPPFPALDLPGLTESANRFRLEEHRGKPVIVNVWASWCGPCRREMPALDRLAAELDTGRVLVLGVNEDGDPDDARAFVHTLGGVRYPLVAGGGRQREAIGYRGLPYTVVLDAEHRVVSAIHGFGDNIESIRDALETAMRSRVGGSP